MPLLLCIDTAVAAASVCISDGSTIVALKSSADPRDSAGWVHTAIRDLLVEHKLSLRNLDAIAVSAGPGSYTGLRVGMATAKGLCFAAGLPLITINTLQAMAAAAQAEPAGLLCPMIDARRMEVFTAVYDRKLREVLPFQPLELGAGSYSDLLNREPVLFFGNGHPKFRAICTHPNALFKEIAVDARHLAPLALARFEQKGFADLAYAEPFYGKAFFNPRF